MSFRLALKQVAVVVATITISFVVHQHLLGVYYQRCNKNMYVALLFRDSTFCRWLHMATNLLEVTALRAARTIPGTTHLTRLLAAATTR